MLHEIFEGSHYEIGASFGLSLTRQNRFLLEEIPFPVTEERRQFAKACLPAYRAHFPEILEEIAGLAAGQQCREEEIQALLFGMYALPPACGCSCFAVSRNGQTLLGRNSDFDPASEPYNTNVIYRFSQGGSCDFTGNTTAFLEMEDGVNAHGLAVGLTFVVPTGAEPGLNAGMLLRLFLEKCRTTAEALAMLNRLPIASSHTFTLADAKGEIALAECSPQGVEAVRPTAEHPFVCATNRFCSGKMAGFQRPGAETWHSDTRQHTMEQALSSCRGRLTSREAQELLAGRQGFLCQYDPACGTDTVWSVVYDLSRATLSRAEGNPSRRPFFQDSRFAFAGE